MGAFKNLIKNIPFTINIWKLNNDKLRCHYTNNLNKNIQIKKGMSMDRYIKKNSLPIEDYKFIIKNDGGETSFNNWSIIRYKFLL